MRELAAIVAEFFAGCEVTVGPLGGDNRSYRVRFDKIAARLAGFKCEWNACRGAAELARLFEHIGFDGQAYALRAFTRLKQLLFLRRTGRIDERFFWRTA